MAFQDDEEARVWAQFSAAALTGLLTARDGPYDSARMVNTSAQVADSMLRHYVDRCGGAPPVADEARCRTCGSTRAQRSCPRCSTDANMGRGA